MMLKLADAIDEHAEEIGRIESENVGKPFASVMRDEMPVMTDHLRFFAGAARMLEGRAVGEYFKADGALFTSMLRREPVGVVGLIAPWNYPLWMAIWKFGPALAAGNTVVLKPSEWTPVVVFDDANLESSVEWIKIAGYFNSGQDCTAATRVLAGPRVYDSLVENLVSSVGSMAVGDPLDESTEMGPVVSKEHFE